MERICVSSLQHNFLGGKNADFKAVIYKNCSFLKELHVLVSIASEKFEMVDMKTACDKEKFDVREQAWDGRLCYCMLLYDLHTEKLPILKSLGKLNKHLCEMN